MDFLFIPEESKLNKGTYSCESDMNNSKKGESLEQSY